MLSKRELLELRAKALAHAAEPNLSFEYTARIITSRISDPAIQADMTEFVRKILLAVTNKRTKTKDTAARQVCWGIMAALAVVGDRIIEEAPDHDPSSSTQ